MSNNNSNVGTPGEVHDLVGEYLGPMPNRLLVDDTNALLGALLLEMQTQRLSGGGPADLATYLAQRQQQEEAGGTETTATYHADHYDLTTKWTEVDLEFVTTELDLRNISAAVQVAFAEPSGEEDVIVYDDTDSPVAGIPAATSTVWLRSDSGTASLDMEAWA